MTLPRVDTVLQLADKRRLAYAEYGDTNGAPVFLFHGLPGSRLSWGLIPDALFPPGLRIIAPDRPGYGKSDPKPDRTLLDWPDDIVELADALGIEKFALVGVSGVGWRAWGTGLRLENSATPDSCGRGRESRPH